MERYKLDIKKEDVKVDAPTKAMVGEKSIVVLEHNGAIYAMDSECTHEGGPLEDGYVDGDELICSWHSGAFCIMNGKANENTPWASDTKSYKIVEEGSDLFVEM